jgi:hypothetical protein
MISVLYSCKDKLMHIYIYIYIIRCIKEPSCQCPLFVFRTMCLAYLMPLNPNVRQVGVAFNHSTRIFLQPICVTTQAKCHLAFCSGFAIMPRSLIGLEIGYLLSLRVRGSWIILSTPLTCAHAASEKDADTWGKGYSNPPLLQGQGEERLV